MSPDNLASLEHQRAMAPFIDCKAFIFPFQGSRWKISIKGETSSLLVRGPSSLNTETRSGLSSAADWVVSRLTRWVFCPSKRPIVIVVTQSQPGPLISNCCQNTLQLSPRKRGISEFKQGHKRDFVCLGILNNVLPLSVSFCLLIEMNLSNELWPFGSGEQICLSFAPSQVSCTKGQFPSSKI